uniref:Uncharacterized protein n=1 Tax=Meloidogyne javanica TaxID=6303 RepID=A0A915LT83_MELJA
KPKFAAADESVSSEEGADAVVVDD